MRGLHFKMVQAGNRPGAVVTLSSLSVMACCLQDACDRIASLGFCSQLQAQKVCTSFLMPNHVSYRRVTDLRGQRYFSLAAVRETVLRISLHAAQQIQDESCRQAGERADAFNSRTGLRWHVFLS